MTGLEIAPVQYATHVKKLIVKKLRLNFLEI